jgi:hypothetical protein
VKFRIKEVSWGGNSVYYAQRFVEDYEEWVNALHCTFNTLKDAEEALDYYYTSIQQLIEAPKEHIHEYQPRMNKHAY